MEMGDKERRERKSKTFPYTSTRQMTMNSASADGSFATEEDPNVPFFSFRMVTFFFLLFIDFFFF